MFSSPSTNRAAQPTHESTNATQAQKAQRLTLFQMEKNPRRRQKAPLRDAGANITPRVSASLQAGRILPGFMILSGSSARLIIAMKGTAAPSSLVR